MPLERQEFAHGVAYRCDLFELLDTLADGTVDLSVQDPPYCSGGATLATKQQDPVKKYLSSAGQSAFPSFTGDNLDQLTFVRWCQRWGRETVRVLKPGAVHAQFSDWRQKSATEEALQLAGLTWQGTATWDKTEACRPRKGGMRNQCEFITWGSKGKLTGESYLPGVFRARVSPGERQHATAKPLAVISRLVELAPANGVVADWFMGSGTTAVAALRAGRRFLTCDASSEYFDIGCRRIELEEAALAA